MKSKKKMEQMAGILLTMLLIGCNGAPVGPTATPIPPTSTGGGELPSTVTIAPTLEPTASPSLTTAFLSTETPLPTDFPATISPTEYPPLNSHGPYILSDTLLLNPDGSGLKWVSYPEEYGLGNYSPDGEWRVLFTGGFSGDVYIGLAIDDAGWTEISLSLLHVPDGKIIKVATVATWTTFPNWGECGSPVSNLIHVKWSPDGRYLAFIADPTGTSLELFTYDTDAGLLRRLTNDEADVLDISWSPDGKKIYYTNGFPQKQWNLMPYYNLFTLNMTEPENSPNQGIQTFYTGEDEIKIVWMDGESGLISLTTKNLGCMSGLYETAEFSYLSLATGEKNTIWAGPDISPLALDPIDGAILLFADGKYSIVEFNGKVTATPEGLSDCSGEYLGDPKNTFLCISSDRKKIIGISFGGQVEEVVSLLDDIQGMSISPDRKWFVVDHSEGIDLYSRKGALVYSWPHATAISGYLWPPDERGVYFSVEGGQLYYWPFADPNPSLIFECPPTMTCLGSRQLTWVP